jgi:hypothetical protein
MMYEKTLLVEMTFRAIEPFDHEDEVLQELLEMENEYNRDGKKRVHFKLKSN